MRLTIKEGMHLQHACFGGGVMWRVYPKTHWRVFEEGDYEIGIMFRCCDTSNSFGCLFVCCSCVCFLNVAPASVLSSGYSSRLFYYLSLLVLTLLDAFSFLRRMIWNFCCSVIADSMFFVAFYGLLLREEDVFLWLLGGSMRSHTVSMVRYVFLWRVECSRSQAVVGCPCPVRLCSPDSVRLHTIHFIKYENVLNPIRSAKGCSIPVCQLLRSIAFLPLKEMRFFYDR